MNKTRPELGVDLEKKKTFSNRAHLKSERRGFHIPLAADSKIEKVSLPHALASPDSHSHIPSRHHIAGQHRALYSKEPEI